MDFIKKVMNSVGVATGVAPGFPYTLADPNSKAIDCGIWKISQGSHITTKAEVTIFSFTKSQNPDTLTAARNALRRLKTVRHPRILRFLDGVETDSRVFMATEPVIALTAVLDDLRKDPDWMLWCSYNLMNALHFLHHVAGMVHGAVRPPSIFLTKGGEAKLGGFELACPLRETESLLPGYRKYLGGAPPADWPPELTETHRGVTWRDIQKLPIHAIDSFMLGNLISFLYDNQRASIKAAGSRLPPPLLSFCREALGQDPTRRPNPGRFVDSTMGKRLFAESPIISLAEQIDQLSGIGIDERDQICADMQREGGLDRLPASFVAHKLIPELVKILELPQVSLEAIKLTIKATLKLDDQVFQGQVLPLLLILFQRPDRAIRLVLLDLLPVYIERIPAKVVQDQLFAQIAAGFTDGMPALREQTLKASLLLAPKLNSRILNNELLRYYARLQMDEQPGIRVNTVVCLGKISKFLEESTRQKVLGVALCRALHDPFIPSRLAALTALHATMDAITPTDIAQMILPALSPHLINPESADVREQAMKAMMSGLERIQEYASTLQETIVETSEKKTVPKTSASKYQFLASTIGGHEDEASDQSSSRSAKSKSSSSLSSPVSSTKSSSRSQRGSIFSKKTPTNINAPTVPSPISFGSAAASGWDDDDIDGLPDFNNEDAADRQLYPTIPGIESSPLIHFDAAGPIESEEPLGAAATIRSPPEADAWALGSPGIDSISSGWGDFALEGLSGGEDAWGDLEGHLPDLAEPAHEPAEKPVFSKKSTLSVDSSKTSRSTKSNSSKAMSLKKR